MNDCIEKRLLNKVGTIVEFVGPPGTGKTTSCQYFSDKLQDKGFKVITLQYIKDYLHDLSLLVKLYLISETLLLKSPVLARYTGALVKANIYSLDSIYRYFRLLVFEQTLKKILKSQEVDIVLLDQWVIQEIWSATIFKRCAYDTLGYRFKEFYFDTDYVLYFDIDIETASERISNRDTNLSRFDKMDTTKRLQELTKYNKYLFHLFEQSDCRKKHVFSTVESPVQNAGKFMHCLNLVPENDLEV